MYFCNLINHLAAVQYRLSRKVIKKDSFSKVESIVGIDISFSRKNRAMAAAVVVDLDSLKILEKKTQEVELLFPYIPGFLGFREVNAMVSILNRLNSDFNVAMINGHGILHPRGFGLASHVGVLADVPTIGVAKRLIGGTYTYHDNSFKRYNEHDIHLKIVKSKGKPLGVCIKGVYISIGHKISLKTALDIVYLVSVFKIPEPVRQAHILATETAKQELK